jgi:hypothetical protein
MRKSEGMEKPFNCNATRFGQSRIHLRVSLTVHGGKLAGYQRLVDGSYYHWMRHTTTILRKT